MFSRREHLLLCTFYEIPEETDLEHPNNRFFQRIERSDVVDVLGQFPERSVTPIITFLVPLSYLVLDENFDRSENMSAREKLSWVIPALYGVPSDRAFERLRYDDPPLISRTKSAAEERVRRAARLIRLASAVALLIWAGISIWRLRKLRYEYAEAVSALESSTGSAVPRIGWTGFLYGDLDEEIQKLASEARSLKKQSTVERSRQFESRTLTELLRGYLETSELSRDEARELEQLLATNSLEELRQAKVKFEPIVQLRRQQAEFDKQQHRNRLREIQRLESEFEAVPLEKREIEARTAWMAYRQAQLLADSTAKLNLLKEARKNLPKEFRPNRF